MHVKIIIKCLLVHVHINLKYTHIHILILNYAFHILFKSYTLKAIIIYYRVQVATYSNYTLKYKRKRMHIRINIHRTHSIQIHVVSKWPL